jgi:hypothetical protein
MIEVNEDRMWIDWHFHSNKFYVCRCSMMVRSIWMKTHQKLYQGRMYLHIEWHGQSLQGTYLNLKACTVGTFCFLATSLWWWGRTGRGPTWGWVLPRCMRPWSGIEWIFWDSVKICILVHFHWKSIIRGEVWPCYTSTVELVELAGQLQRLGDVSLNVWFFLKIKVVWLKFSISILGYTSIV